ncbi:CatB-related O-acetyltransferase [Nocardioides xinjiangensis]|uniref:CatB-related O-acetyltransferase n=1 Tax=Nocardioides xinjiangensis TaxID=2817376 RepID=UPI001B30827A|nr:CatB-related O-acetyltransferase [Nocardioides sp. SYSU D00514]
MTAVTRVRSRLRGLARRVAGPAPGQLPSATRLDERADLRQYDIGRYSWGHLTVSSRGPGTMLTVGQFCSFAYGTHIVLGGEHRADFVSTYRFPAYPPFNETHRHLAEDTSVTRGAVVIGNDVWLGHQTLVLSGVTIGDGAIIGAGSVVRHDIPPYAIVAGNPARVAGFRFPPEQIAALLELKWWDWPVDRIGRHLDTLLSDDVAGFVAAATQDPVHTGGSSG